jgi:hypothetical protein
MSEDDAGILELKKEVNCYAEDNMALLSILGLDVEKPSKRSKTKSEARKTLVEFSPTWKRVSGITIVEGERVTTLSAKSAENWTFARMRGYLGAGELSWTLCWKRDTIAAITAGVEDEHQCTRLFDFQTGRTQDELNRQEQLFELPECSELTVRFRLSFSEKKLLISINDLPFKPAFRLRADTHYVPIVGFASSATVTLTELNLKN